MSFVSTFNSLSARGWTGGSSAGQGYVKIDLLTNVGVGTCISISDDANYLAASNTTSAGSIQIYTINNGLLTFNQTLTGNLTGAQMGESMSLNADGSYLVTGAAFAGNTDAGAVRIYSRSGTTWSFQQDIIGNIGFENLGSSVAIDNLADRFVTRGGSNGYVYSRSSTTWSLEQAISAGSTVNKVDIDGAGNTLILGCPSVSSSTGEVLVYSRSGNTWSLSATLTGSTTGPGDNFGYNAVINEGGNTIAVSAPDQDISGNVNVGSIYIFTYNGSSWTEVDNITPLDILDNARLGGTINSLQISDDANTIVAGAYVSTTATEGTIYTYLGNGTQWQLNQEIIHSNTIPSYEWFGFAIGLDGDARYLSSSFGNNTPQGNLVLYTN